MAYRDRGERKSVSACVRDQRAALFHTKSRTTTYHVRWEEVAVAFDSVVENDDIGESGGYWKFNEEVLEPNVYALKQQRGVKLPITCLAGLRGSGCPNEPRKW
jgi:hypothetical protein